jgi:hypothetical protein
VFPSNIVVRSMKDDGEMFQQQFSEILQREDPTAHNSSLHIGVPANEAELGAVFKSGGADWDLWRSVGPAWRRAASRSGFNDSSAASASADQIVEALTKSKNVIIVIAHANGQTIHMPAPPPEGSTLSGDQLRERRAEIGANKPVVYLLCCETAEISEIPNFASVLLECGATAVIAPQSKLHATRSINFFELLMSDKGMARDTLRKFKEAQRRSGHIEMEIWLV